MTKNMTSWNGKDTGLRNHDEGAKMIRVKTMHEGLVRLRSVLNLVYKMILFDGCMDLVKEECADMDSQKT